MSLINDIYNLPLDDEETWNTICNGNVVGVFQLDGLGIHYSKELKPRNITELADLVSVIRPGCVSGDTKIRVKTYSNYRNNGYSLSKYITLQELYHNQDKYKCIISYNMDSGKYISNNIENVFYTGRKETVKLNIIPGKTLSRYNSKIKLKCTLDHKILTNHGWKEVKDLKIGDRVAINRHNKKYKRRSKNIFGEKYFKEICYYTYEYKCVMCDWMDGGLDVNHLIGNRKTDNSPENLCFLCPNHHRMYSEGTLKREDIIANREKYILPKSESIIWGQYLGFQNCGVEDVYDITMMSPHHNFIAGNVVVHNCLGFKIKGKNITEKFINRKNGIEEVEYIHPELQSSLESTYGFLVYQEQVIHLVQHIAGFTPQQADVLRKAIGTKDAEIMSSLETDFIDGCENVGKVDAESAKEIFENIRASQQYSFNLSILSNTNVKTPEKYITIEDLHIGDLVDSPDGFIKVINKYDHGIQDVYEITTESGKKITCSILHKFLCSDNVVRPLIEIIENNHKIQCSSDF